MGQGWTISLVEKKLDMFGRYDNWILGRDAGHSFMKLQGPNGENWVLEGNAYTPSNGSLAKGEQTNAGYLSAAANEIGLGQIFNKAARLFNYDLNVPRLRVSMEDGDAFTQPGDEIVEHPLREGSEEVMRALWTEMTNAGVEINKADLMYQGIGFNDYGVNCHSVMRAMMDVMNIPRDEQPDFVYAAPGGNNNLFETVPGLTAFTADTPEIVDAQEQKLLQNDASLALADSMTSPELSARIAAAADRQLARSDSHWGYGTYKQAAAQTYPQV